jgi:hypothetical protein
VLGVSFILHEKLHVVEAHFPMLDLFHDGAIFIYIIDSLLFVRFVLPEHEHLPVPTTMPVPHHLLNSFALYLPAKHTAPKFIKQL